MATGHYHRPYVENYPWGYSYWGSTGTSITTNSMTTNDESMNKLTALAKRFLDADTKKLIKAGLLNKDLSVTSQGEWEINALLIQKYKEELVKVADEIISERESKK